MGGTRRLETSTRSVQKTFIASFVVAGDFLMTGHSPGGINGVVNLFYTVLQSRKS